MRFVNRAPLIPCRNFGRKVAILRRNRACVLVSSLVRSSSRLVYHDWPEALRRARAYRSSRGVLDGFAAIEGIDCSSDCANCCTSTSSGRQIPGNSRGWCGAAMGPRGSGVEVVALANLQVSAVPSVISTRVPCEWSSCVAGAIGAPKSCRCSRLSLVPRPPPSRRSQRQG